MAKREGMLMKNDNPCECCQEFHGKDRRRGRRYYRRVERQRVAREIREMGR